MIYIYIFERGVFMRKKKFLKKTLKGLLSLLLAITIMTGFGVPVSVFADEDYAEGENIYAALYLVDPNKKDEWGNVVNKQNIER